MPADTATLQIHLTMDAVGHGLARRRGAGRVVAGLVGSVSKAAGGRRAGAGGRGRCRPWSRSFHDDPRRRRDDDRWPLVEIAAARNEQEPLQLAVRSRSGDLPSVRVEVEPPVGPRAASGWTTSRSNVVGYVPDRPPDELLQSSSPAWHRKVPTAAGQLRRLAGAVARPAAAAAARSTCRPTRRSRSGSRSASRRTRRRATTRAACG